MKECMIQLNEEMINGFIVTTEEAIKLFSSGKCRSMDMSLTKIPFIKMVLTYDPITNEPSVTPIHHKRIKEIN